MAVTLRATIRSSLILVSIVMVVFIIARLEWLKAGDVLAKRPKRQPMIVVKEKLSPLIISTVHRSLSIPRSFGWEYLVGYSRDPR
jgi:hypothetical protein